jgi:phage gpG-like protein
MIEIRILGSETTQLALKSFGLGVKERLREAITRSAIELTRYVKERKLSGQVLKNRTGTLRRKINYAIRETVSEISAAVGVKLSYAAVHEYGFDGVVSVKEHLRTIKQAWGRPIAPTEVAVHAHSRHMHLPERSFLRSSLRERGPSIREALSAAVVAAGGARG